MLIDLNETERMPGKAISAKKSKLFIISFFLRKWQCFPQCYNVLSDKWFKEYHLMQKDIETFHLELNQRISYCFN
jgi:hypothetical protein